MSDRPNLSSSDCCCVVGGSGGKAGPSCTLSGDTGTASEGSAGVNTTSSQQRHTLRREIAQSLYKRKKHLWFLQWLPTPVLRGGWTPAEKQSTPESPLTAAAAIRRRDHKKVTLSSLWWPCMALKEGDKSSWFIHQKHRGLGAYAECIQRRRRTKTNANKEPSNPVQGNSVLQRSKNKRQHPRHQQRIPKRKEKAHLGQRRRVADVHNA